MRNPNRDKKRESKAIAARTSPSDLLQTVMAKKYLKKAGVL